MSVDVTRVNRSNSEPSPARPHQTRLPPLSSILNRSPSDRSNSLTDTPPRKLMLPSIENLTSSPGFKRSNSFPQTTFPSLSNDQHHQHSHHHSNTAPNSSITPNSTFVPITPISHHVLPPPPPMFTHSTPSTRPPPPPHFVQPSSSQHSPANSQHQPPQQPPNLYTPFKDKTPLKNTPQSTPPSGSKSFAFISHSQATFLSSEPDIDNARLARRKRRRTSPTELAILQAEFEKGNTPNKMRRLEIAAKVDMTEKAVQIWFQNKRQSLRKNNQSIKEIVLNIPERHDLDQQLMTAEELESINSSNSTTSSGTSSANTTLNDIPAVATTEESVTKDNLTDSSPSSSPSPEVLADLTHPQNQQHGVSLHPMPQQLPPKGVFVTPMKTPQKRDASYIAATPQQNSSSMTFKFRASEMGLMTPMQSMTKRQKPTMRLNVRGGSGAAANKALGNVFKDSTNVKNNTSARKTEVKKEDRSDIECVENLLSLRRTVNGA